MLNQKKEAIMERIREAIVSDEERRKLLFCLLSAAMSLTSFVMSLVNLLTKEYTLMATTLAYGAVSLVCAVAILRHANQKKRLYICFSLATLLLLTFFFVSGIPDGFSALWCCVIPYFALLILGLQGGLKYSLVSLLLLMFWCWSSLGRSLLQYDYSEAFLLRFPFLYGAVLLISLITEWIRQETQRQLEKSKDKYYYLYRHDALTGLENRFGISEYIDTVLGKGVHQRVAAVLMDIDDFKHVNDTYGHEMGDEVLKHVAKIPLRMLSGNARFCRWGGEEFLLLMQGDADPLAMAEDIRREIEKTPIPCGQGRIHVTISMGIGMVDDAHGIDIHALIDQADQALYYSKQHGKNQVTVYQAGMQEKTACNE